MKRSLVPRLALVLLVASGVPVGAAPGAREPRTAHEPADSRRQTVLSAATGRAVVTSDGRRERVRLRRGERLLEIAELGRGWVAAGVREAAEATDIVVVRDAAAGDGRLPSPARGGGLRRAAPRLLVDGDGLAGVAWLEGARPDRMAVRAAQWTGGAWTASAVVAPPAPGSQTGLAQAVLADGSWLLVWSRFDGRENDLYWSRWRGAAWSSPAPVERPDGVPDVTPTLIAAGDGALLAWSEYDGSDYRLRGARFDADGSWRPLAVDAGRGALQPRFRRRGEGTWLLLRSAVPRGWAALEIGADGAAGRLARVESRDLRRPLLRPDGGAGLRFEWPGAPPLRGAWEAPAR